MVSLLHKPANGIEADPKLFGYVFEREKIRNPVSQFIVPDGGLDLAQAGESFLRQPRLL